MAMMSKDSTKRFMLLGALLCASALAIGSVLALARARAGSPVAQDISANLPAENTNHSALKQLDPGSASVQFPAALSDLGDAPSSIVLDASGNLWAVWSTFDGKLVLAEYEPSTGVLDKHTLPATEPGPNPQLGIDSLGDLVVGIGPQVFRVDPQSLEFTTFTLQDSKSTVVAPPGALGTITGMRVVGDSAFISRLGESTVTELSLRDGQTRVTAVPDSFGGFDDFIVTDSTIWVIKNGDTLNGGPPAQVGRIDRASGTLSIIPVRVRDAVPYADGLVAVTWTPQGPDAVALIGLAGSSPVNPGQLTDGFLGHLGDTKMTGGTGTVWMADSSANAIAWLNPSTGASGVINLPVWQLPGNRISCPMGTDCSSPEDINTDVRNLATTSAGGLYFVDATLDRIGFIPAPK